MALCKPSSLTTQKARFHRTLVNGLFESKNLGKKVGCNPAQSRYNPGKDSNIPNVEKLGEK
jgi:hypothetical protein